jgi:hypothetical protein
VPMLSQEDKWFYETTLVFGGGNLTYFNPYTLRIMRDSGTGNIEDDTYGGYKILEDEDGPLDFVKATIRHIEAIYVLREDKHLRHLVRLCDAVTSCFTKTTR